ncbi:hypothetical protein F5I97DRAFT_1845305 [Phlebopus sp. FC_14]|nr:hypothetical protein F5I97DRAFT_1845305 [Phlebopus sp. FC_14]
MCHNLGFGFPLGRIPFFFFFFFLLVARLIQRLRNVGLGVSSSAGAGRVVTSRVTRRPPRRCFFRARWRGHGAVQHKARQFATTGAFCRKYAPAMLHVSNAGMPAVVMLWRSQMLVKPACCGLQQPTSIQP